MVLASKKGAWAVHFPSVLLILVPFVLFSLSLTGGLIVFTLARSRLLRRKGNVVTVAAPFKIRTVEVTESTRVVVNLPTAWNPYVRLSPKWVFGLTTPEGTKVTLASSDLIGDSPQEVSRRLAAALSVPLAEDIGWARSDSEGKAPSGLRPWLGRHRTPLLAIAGLLAVLGFLSFAVDNRPAPQIAMPCAGNGFDALLWDGPFLKRNHDISGSVNPGEHEIAVWDPARRCWAQKEISVEPGQRMNVNCEWVKTSSVCLPPK